MGCMGCGSGQVIMTKENGVCKVCSIVDKDNGIKAVVYLEAFKAKICPFCAGSPARIKLAFPNAM